MDSHHNGKVRPPWSHWKVWMSLGKEGKRSCPRNNQAREADIPRSLTVMGGGGEHRNDPP